MVDAEVPLHHKLFQVAKAKPKPEIPANAQDDDLSFEMPSFECCWPGSPHARASLANRRRRLCNTSEKGMHCLTSVVNSNIFMANGALNQGAESSPHECRSWPAAAWSRAARGRSPARLPSTGLSPSSWKRDCGRPRCWQQVIVFNEFALF